MYYEEAGKGRTVIFLHGWGGSIASFKGTFTYLSKYFHCVNLEFHGFGNSETPKTPYTIYDYADELKEFIGFLNCGAVTVIGHSFGGRVALILAAEAPELVGGVILIDAAGLKPRRGLKYFFRKLTKQGSPDYRALSGVMRKTFVNVVNEHLNRFTHRIKCHALIIWGGKDKDTPPWMARYLNRHIVNSRLIVFKNAGHYSYIDRFDECNMLLLDWLVNYIEN